MGRPSGCFIGECRLRDSGERAYAYLVRNTDPTALNFEFDSYWFADGGADCVVKDVQRS